MDTETLPRFHEDANIMQVIGQPVFHDHLGNGDNGDLEYVVVFAFGPDAYYHAIRIVGVPGVILDRRLNDIETEEWDKAFLAWTSTEDSRICPDCTAAENQRAGK